MISFLPILTQVYPRILTQVCRDPGSACFGSFDRNWWHYKIRDFSSVILQQGGYMLDLLSESDHFRDDAGHLRQLSEASVDFWALRCLKRGAFEEYYPWEDGYPPLAFSTLAAAKIIGKRKLTGEITEAALKKASTKLIDRFENQAANQQIAGLAALAVIRKSRPHLVDDRKFEMLIQKTLMLQHEEGWFPEYDGPDLGYLSVSLDCLWDLLDHTGDQRFMQSAGKAFLFLAGLVRHMSGSVGMHNARNTDYIVPYGICRFLQDGREEEKKEAFDILSILFKDLDSGLHFLRAIDDRYWVHYIGHSVVRAHQLLENNPWPETATKIEANPMEKRLLKGSGYYMETRLPGALLISCLKGGVLTLKQGTCIYNDYGWIIQSGKVQYVTHWWNVSNSFFLEGNSLIVKGFALPHRENISTPLKHFILRLLSFIAGSRIINILKNRLIFKHYKTGFGFERRVEFLERKIIIRDKIGELKDNDSITRAPRFSKRHVASADSFHTEDFKPVSGFKISSETRHQGNEFYAVTDVEIT